MFDCTISASVIPNNSFILGAIALMNSPLNWGVLRKLTPQSGQHGNDLLFTAHNPGQEQGIVLGYHAEGLLNDLVVAHVNQLCALFQHVGEHQNDHGKALFFHGGLHQAQKLLFPFQHLGTVHAGDLGYGQIVSGNVEILIVGVKQILRGAVFQRCGEELYSMLCGDLSGKEN